jgi:hypothetical protein
MITERASIIGDRQLRYFLIDKAVRIVKDKYKGKFSAEELTSLDSFSSQEKETLKNIFSNNFTRVYAWEHNFYFDESIWRYEEATYNYEGTMIWILLLLNNSTTPIGEKVYTDDYSLIENLYRGWNNLWDDEIEEVQGGNRIYKVNLDAIEFLSQNLKTRIGDYCKFDFEFVKTFMESLCDYHKMEVEECLLRMLRK